MIANGLLQDYRTANLTARTTPAPDTFSAPWSLQRTTLPSPPSISVTDADIRKAEAALDTAIAEVSSSFDDAITQFEPLDALKRRLSDA